MAKDFISDAEMSQLEKAGKATLPQFTQKDFISDDEMTSLESQGLAQRPEAKKESRQGQAALESFGQGLTFGHLPHLQAVAEPIADRIFDFFTGQNVADMPRESYVERRDRNIKRIKELQKEYPKTALASELAGGVVTGTALTPLLPASAPAAGIGSKLVQAGKVGAVYGAASNPGDVEGEISPLQLTDRGKYALIGAGTGAAAQGAIEGVGKASKGIADYLRGFSEKKAARAVGRPTPTMTSKMEASGQDKELGRALLDEKAIPIFGTSGRIAKRVDKLREKAGEEVGSLVKAAGDKKVIDTEALAISFLDSPEIALLRKTPGAEGMVSSAEQFAETLAKNKTLSLSEAQKLRQLIDKQINFSKKSVGDKGKEALLYDLRNGLRDKMDDAIAELQIAEKGALRAANKRYNLFTTADEISGRELGKQQGNRTVSLTDTITGSAGFAAGFASGDSFEDRLKRGLIGASLGAVNKLGRSTGSAMMARGANTASNVISKVPAMAEFAKRNPEKFQILINRMSVDSGKFEKAEDPIFRDNQLMELFEKHPELIDNVEDQKLKVELMKRFNRSPSDEDNAIKRRLKQSK